MTRVRDVAEIGPFTVEAGETVPDFEVAYEAYGDVEDGVGGDRDVVLICHALTGSQHVADPDGDDGRRDQARAWWDEFVGPGKAVDTTRYDVVCANVPGSCYGTTGPASENPETGEPYGPDFPPVSVADWTRAQRRLLDHLGVDRLHAVLGGSVGGMNVLDWARRYPGDVDRIAPVAAAARLDAQSLAFDAVARRAITGDRHWDGGRYYDRDHPDPDRGLAIARQIGHLLYLSKSSVARKFGRRGASRDLPDARALFPDDPSGEGSPYRDVESYLDYQARTFVERFDANSYLYLLRAMDEFDLAAGYGGDAPALAAFEGEALLLSFTADWHFPVEQSAHLARVFREADLRVAHHVVDTDHGHDAFLVEPERVGPPLHDFLADGVEGSAVTDAGADVGDGSGRPADWVPAAGDRER
ncbi:MAG: homoserine O-acetyltransferase [Halobacteriaceae archaeon]